MPRSFGRMRVFSRVGLLLAMSWALVGCDRGPAPLPPEALKIRINLMCTTCDDFLRCQRADTDAESYRIYRLREKSVWAQIATIGDYLVQWLHRKTSDTRPLTVYDNLGDLRQIVSEDGRARVDRVTGLLTLPDGSIDLRDGQWRSVTGEPQGECRTMPRREGYAWVRALLGRALPTGASP